MPSEEIDTDTLCISVGEWQALLRNWLGEPVYVATKWIEWIIRTDNVSFGAFNVFLVGTDPNWRRYVHE